MSIQWTPWNALYQRTGYPTVDMDGLQLMDVWNACVKEEDEHEHVDESARGLDHVALQTEGAR